MDFYCNFLMKFFVTMSFISFLEDMFVGMGEEFQFIFATLVSLDYDSNTCIDRFLYGHNTIYSASGL